MTKESMAQAYRQLMTWFERFLALIVLLGILAYGAGSAAALVQLDWRQNETFYELIYRVLLLVIGLELIRMLLTHELYAILELLAFVIARKMLKPESTSVDIALSVLAFVALVAASRYLFDGKRVGWATTDRRSPDDSPRSELSSTPETSAGGGGMASTQSREATKSS